MKEHIQSAGVRRWYGQDFLDLQHEQLEVLQDYFAQFGPCIISGCEVTPNGGSNWDIDEGLAVIEHADGWKIVRVEAVVNTALPGYFQVGKAAISGTYGTGAATVANRYHCDNSQWTAGATAAADTKLIIPDPSAATTTPGDNIAPRIENMQKQIMLGPVKTIAIPGGYTYCSGNIKFQVNFAARQLYISGNIAVDTSALSLDYGDVDVLLLADLNADADLSPWLPKTDSYWTAHEKVQLGVRNFDPMMMWFDNSRGIVLDAHKGTFNCYFTAVIPLDL